MSEQDKTIEFLHFQTTDGKIVAFQFVHLHSFPNGARYGVVPFVQIITPKEITPSTDPDDTDLGARSTA